MTIEARELARSGRVGPISARFEPGTITAICGPNGAGKSSLLELLAGLETAEGQVLHDGHALARLSPRERAQAIGYLPQHADVAWDLSVRSLAMLGRLPYRDSAQGPVDRALTALDLAQLASRPVMSLSGGERARALLARVLVGEPRWILADEPFAALDLAHQLALLGHLRASADAGAGVIVVLHDLAHAMNHADRVLVLDRGRLAAEGTPSEALGESVIERIWGVRAAWHGGQGARALAAPV